MKQLTMPSFGADMATGIIAQWKVQPGDKVKKGDIVASIDTMKGLIDMEVFDDGVIDKLLAAEGEDIEVGQPIAQLTLADEPRSETDAPMAPQAALSQKPIPAPNVKPFGQPIAQPTLADEPRSATETPKVAQAALRQKPIPAPNVKPVGQPVTQPTLADEPRSATGAPKDPQAPLSQKPTPAKVKQQSPIPGADKVDIASDSDRLPADNETAVRRRISPAARQKAAELAIDWRQLQTGSGPQGAIVLDDITTMANASTEGAHPPERDSGQQMREAIAAVVSRSKKEIPHYYLQQDMQLDNVLAWSGEYNHGRPVNERILPSALLYCAIARALSSFTQFNGFYLQGRYQAQDSVHLGNAISLHGGGLMVADIHNAQQLNPAQMMLNLSDQVLRAREGGLRMSEMQDATITVSNLGDRGTDSMQSIIFPPQVAIVAIGRQRCVPWVVGEQVNMAHIVTVSLAADHRVSDGHAGARLLNKIDHLLQNPESLI
ncbi:MAG: pyruvate dehydrogenase E2 component (dihydrolipoamide acetyltransferase) [Paraglaciecola sp.]|jgi:pyruvate dehydrogenase E2 component (dihydrolipoamide acetyltransferase)